MSRLHQSSSFSRGCVPRASGFLLFGLAACKMGRPAPTPQAHRGAGEHEVTVRFSVRVQSVILGAWRAASIRAGCVPPPRIHILVLSGEATRPPHNEPPARSPLQPWQVSGGLSLQIQCSCTTAIQTRGSWSWGEESGGPSWTTESDHTEASLETAGFLCLLSSPASHLHGHCMGRQARLSSPHSCSSCSGDGPSPLTSPP